MYQLCKLCSSKQWKKLCYKIITVFIQAKYNIAYIFSIAYTFSIGCLQYTTYECVHLLSYLYVCKADFVVYTYFIVFCMALML